MVQRWTGSHVANLMRHSREAGGGLLVTDLRRKRSILELQPNLMDVINDRLHHDGSNLSGVTTQYFAWFPISSGVLNEPVPGEAALSRRRPKLTADDESRDWCMHPTDLSLPRGSDSSAPQQFPVAMDTEDTMKSNEDEEFIDVVGDGSSSSVTASDAVDSQPVVMSTADCGQSNEASNSPTATLPQEAHIGSNQPINLQSSSAPTCLGDWRIRIGAVVGSQSSTDGIDVHVASG